MTIDESKMLFVKYGVCAYVTFEFFRTQPRKTEIKTKILKSWKFN